MRLQHTKLNDIQKGYSSAEVIEIADSKAERDMFPDVSNDASFIVHIGNLVLK